MSYIFRSAEEQAEDREFLAYLKGNGRYSMEEYFEELQLTNKLSIRDWDELNAAERKITQRRAAALKSNPLAGNFDFEHLKNIHKAVFQDIYYFAGEMRTVDMEIDSITRFTKVSKIEAEAQRIFKNVRDKNCFKGMDKPEFIKNLADFMTDINMLHPFREGNGRSKRIFIDSLCENANYRIDWEAADKQAWIVADATAFDTSADNTQQRDTSYLKILLDKALLPNRQESSGVAEIPAVATAMSPALQAMRTGYRVRSRTNGSVAANEENTPIDTE